jgi:hypothetical protein
MPSYPEEFFDFKLIIILIISASVTGCIFIFGKPLGK